MREVRHTTTISVLILSLLASCSVKSGRTGNRGAYYGPYQNLYLGGFRRLSKPDSESIRQVGDSRPYPMATDRIWDACLNVILQYDAVAYLSPESHIAVFAHGLPMQAKPGEHGPAPYYDTLLVMHLRDVGPRRTEVYLAWMPPEDMERNPIPSLPSGFDWTDIEKCSEQTIRKAVTAIVAVQFCDQLSTQLLYKERWQKKFQF